MRSPLLKNAILACTANHLCGIGQLDQASAEHYHSECLRLLIPVLNDPTTALNETTLAAIVILRGYEEMSGRVISSVPPVQN